MYFLIFYVDFTYKYIILAYTSIMDINELAEDARNKKEVFIAARGAGASYDELTKLADEYSSAIALWHKSRFPSKKFTKPSVGYLIRAL
jgi:hypothetical protein